MNYLNIQFLYMAGPLEMGLSVVFVASLGSMFLSPTTALGAMYVYGGLLLFSGFLLYDTQRIIRKANNSRPYDPIYEAIPIFSFGW